MINVKNNIWEAAINVFSSLLLFFGIWIVLLLIKENNFDLRILAIFLIPIVLAVGIFMRRDLARRICLWYCWIIGLSAIFSCLLLDYDSNILHKNIIEVSVFLILISIFLEFPKIRDRFR